MRSLFLHRTLPEIETRKRIKLAVWAYAYEIEDNPIVSDQEFDRMAESINLNIMTGRIDLDMWWMENFQPHTGQWIHEHPELAKVKQTYERYY